MALCTIIIAPSFNYEVFGISLCEMKQVRHFTIIDAIETNLEAQQRSYGGHLGDAVRGKEFVLLSAVDCEKSN